MRKFSICSFLIIVYGISSGGSIDTLSSWSGSSMHTFGELSGQNPGGFTFGQTFNIPGTNALLNNISFKVDDYMPGTAQEVCTFGVLRSTESVGFGPHR